MWRVPIIVRRMDPTPDQRRDALRSFIQEQGISVASWAKRAGVSANSIHNFLGGRSNSLSVTAYGKLARVSGVPVWRLTGDRPEPPSPTAIMVAGHVQAGDYREAVEWNRDDWYSVDVPVPARFRPHAKALEVRGTSMNRVYREGAVVVWVDMLDSRPPRTGDRVIVYSHAIGDGVEATVKELRYHDGDPWLWPLSDDPAHQAPINPNDAPPGIDRIEIVGLVVGSYQPEIH